MAAAVVLPREFNHETLTDSKLLTARQRDRIFAELTDDPDVFWAVGVSEVEVIDRDNILRATEQAMVAAFNA